ncbi:YlbF family regulator [Paenibacillus lycopersici]|uniref:YlbF family regulator n=2 Tax=Paenibacillus lycopersici TaxID=2704462 RepID=A0A6C0FYV6_9BACL|nr:YlbF family regulator [Paenibacillus lycopersici]
METLPLSDPAAHELDLPLYESFDSFESGDSTSLDMGQLLLRAYDIGDLVNQSAEVAEYAYWKTVVDEHEQVRELVKKFAKAKELFADCERFGRFHPDYHAAKDKVKEVEAQLNGIECVSRFKAAEQAVDDLLLAIATEIAGAVSETIKVPSNDPLPKGGGCGGGGSCSCGSGGCG